MPAHIVYQSAPLGSVIRYSDGAAKPPSRFTKKLAAWESRNGVGRLVRKEPPRTRTTYTSPASFTHEGDFGQGGIIVVSVRRTWSVESDLRFEIVDRPTIGMVRVPQALGDSPELLHVAKNREAPSAACRQLIWPRLSRGGLRRRGRRRRHRGAHGRLIVSPHKKPMTGPGSRAIAGPFSLHGDRHVRLEQKLLL
ncbi:hypothetical protein [Mesorhizobium sp. 43Arga]